MNTKRKAYTGSLVFLAILFSYQFIFSLKDPETALWIKGFFLVASIAFIFESIKRFRKDKQEPQG